MCRVAAETAQLWDGLGQLGDIVRRYPQTMRSLFLAQTSKLTLVALKRLYCVKWSPAGSNRRNQEEEAVFCVKMFLGDCDSKSCWRVSSNAMDVENTTFSHWRMLEILAATFLMPCDHRLTFLSLVMSKTSTDAGSLTPAYSEESFHLVFDENGDLLDPETPGRRWLTESLSVPPSTATLRRQEAPALPPHWRPPTKDASVQVNADWDSRHRARRRIFVLCQFVGHLRPIPAVDGEIEDHLRDSTLRVDLHSQRQRYDCERCVRHATRLRDEVYASDIPLETGVQYTRLPGLLLAVSTSPDRHRLLNQLQEHPERTFIVCTHRNLLSAWLRATLCTAIWITSSPPEGQRMSRWVSQLRLPSNGHCKVSAANCCCCYLYALVLWTAYNRIIDICRILRVFAELYSFHGIFLWTKNIGLPQVHIVFVYVWLNVLFMATQGSFGHLRQDHIFVCHVIQWRTSGKWVN